jgi:hypothetical protein
MPAMGADISEVVLVAFEGPDRYSFVGGLATRMNDLAEALTARGHRVRHLFVGDPTLPATELRRDGTLLLERWGQWISRYHPKDVYDGEDGKWRDFGRTVPPHLLEEVVVPAARQGKRAVLLFEDWQTANAAINTTVLAQRAGLRGAITPFWNAPRRSRRSRGSCGPSWSSPASSRRSCRTASPSASRSRYLRRTCARCAPVLPGGQVW